MKIRILALILAVFCLSTLLVGCKETEVEPCTAHVDANADNKCDNENCDFEYCDVHKDENADLACDVCAKTLPNCEYHKDVMVDNVCDVCCLPIEIKCEIHKDDNADHICDVCRGVIVTIIEQLPAETEERTDMVVNPIPGGVNLGDYIITDKNDDDILTQESLNYVVCDEVIDYLGNYWVLHSYNEDTDVNTYQVFNYVTGEVVSGSTVTDKAANENTVKLITIDLQNNYFSIAVETLAIDEWGYSSTVALSKTYYEYTGAEIDSAKWDVNSNVDEYWYDMVNAISPSDTFEKNNVRYITFGADRVLAFDVATGAKLGEFDRMSLIYRPAFDAVYADTYGYVEYEGKLFIYDLTKWIECIYSYELPDSSEWFVLANGNVLVQASERVYTGANYDYLVAAARYDLVYTVIDPSAKTAKNVEFGYVINSIETPDAAIYTDKVANIATISPIVDDRVSAKVLTVALNNDLTIAADLTESLKYSANLVADGIFLYTKKLDVTTEATYAVDVNGNVLAYKPYGAIVGENAISYDGKFYSFDMKLVFDPIVGEYTAITGNSSFQIYQKYDEETDSYKLYYYEVGAEKATLIKHQDSDRFAISYQNSSYGYVVSYLKESEDPNEADTVQYTLYNISNEAVKSFSSNISNIITDDNGITIVTLADGNIYIVR